MQNNSHTLYRPPGEANSLIIRIASGCPWNGCRFCGMYKGASYQFPGVDAALQSIREAQHSWPTARRIFLADGDVMHLDFDDLETILMQLKESFPRLARVGIYASGAAILAKTDAQLKRLKELKLNTLYMGLESGDADTLAAMNKRETAGEMIEAAQRAQAAGLRMSVMVLIGLAGAKRSSEHAQATAQALNQMKPRLLSALRLVTTPNTPIFSTFTMLTEAEAVAETRELIEQLDLEGTVFRADHSSNIIPLEGRFPKDKPVLLNQLDQLLKSGRLDTESPGQLPWSL